MARYLEIQQNMLQNLPNRSEQAKLLTQMADYSKRAGEKEQAKELLLEAMEADPKLLDAFHQLEKIYIKEKSWESLVEVYYRQSQLEDSKESKVEYLRKCGDLSEKKLQLFPQSIEFYEELLSLSPKDMGALNSLESLYTITEKWENVVKIMDRIFPLTKDKTGKVKLLMGMALIWSEKFENLAKAAEIYEKALEFQEDPMILEILEETYTVQKNWESLSKVYERRVPLSKSLVDKKNLYINLAQLYEQKLQTISKAIHWTQIACEEFPEDGNLLKDLQRLLKDQGDHEELLASYRKELARTSEKQQKISIYENMAELLMEHNQPKQAADIYEELVSLYPKEIQALRKLEELYKHVNLPEKLLLCLTRIVELLPTEEKPVCYLEIAELLKDTLHREREAVDYYQRLLEITPKI